MLPYSFLSSTNRWTVNDVGRDPQTGSSSWSSLCFTNGMLIPLGLDTWFKPQSMNVNPARIPHWRPTPCCRHIAEGSVGFQLKAKGSSLPLPTAASAHCLLAAGFTTQHCLWPQFSVTHFSEAVWGGWDHSPSQSWDAAEDWQPTVGKGSHPLT